jgi:hypothetical protein
VPFLKAPNQSIRWLFAELVVVVVGILIAFQVEEWRSERLDRQAEKDLLENLLSDLELNELGFENYLNALTTQTDATIDLVDYLDGSPSRSNEELLQIFISLHTSWGWTPTKPTYRSWIASGRPELISDETLRADLFFFYEAWENYIVNLTESWGDVFEAFREASSKDYFAVSERGSEPGKYIRRRQLVQPIEDIPRDSEFMSRMNKLGERAAFLVDRTQMSLVRIEELKQQVQAHLATLQ